MILYPNTDKPTSEWRPEYPQRPLVFLDIDGVINWSPAPLHLDRETRKVLYQELRLSGDRLWANIRLPYWMPKLVNHLTDVAEVVWLTAWQEAANPLIAPVLGIRPLPTLVEGTQRRDVYWKSPTMRPIAIQAHKRGREVMWIEDFGFVDDHLAQWTYPGIPDFVHTLDTLPEGVLAWEDLEDTPVEPYGGIRYAR